MTFFVVGEDLYLTISIQPSVRKDQGWIKVGGDFRVLDKEINYARVYVEMDKSINFLLDTTSLKKSAQKSQLERRG